MADIAELTAVLACALFAGAAIYVSFVEHPARLTCGTATAYQQWAPSYKRGTVMQASLAALAATAGACRWLLGGATSWLAGALLILSVVPFTLVVIFPTNRRLLEPSRDPASEETRRLLKAWGRLHAVRSALGLAATLTFLLALKNSDNAR